MNTNDIKPFEKDIIDDLSVLVSFPSIYSNDEKPFGSNVKACLHKALEIAAGYGFTAVNVDDYCGYIEMGHGDQIIGILAHLDVVPVSETWNTDPFKLTLIDEKYYGRGASDDKGAVVASLTALRMLKPLESTFTKRVRLILGCNEESGSECIKYYKKKLGIVDCGFTPDGDFPLIYGEKGMVAGFFKGKSDIIVDIKGGSVTNAVAASCSLTLNGSPDLQALDRFFKKSNVSYEYSNCTLTVKGVAAHASTPDLGINAISFAMEGLFQGGLHDELIDSYHELVSTTCHGEKLNVCLADDYGDLSFNIGLAYKENDDIIFTIDCRTPVTLDPKTIADTMIQNGKGHVVAQSGAQPLFFPLDSPMISALLSAYRDVTGDTVSEPEVIGGGTYAKTMPNIVAFGCEDNEYNYHIHDDNEFVTMKSLFKQTACYYQAILNLMKI